MCEFAGRHGSRLPRKVLDPPASLALHLAALLTMMQSTLLVRLPLPRLNPRPFLLLELAQHVIEHNRRCSLSQQACRPNAQMAACMPSCSVSLPLP